MKRASEGIVPPKKKPSPSWNKGLLDAMEDPSKVVRSNDLTVTIKDGFPKAKHHYLVLPREDLPNLRALRSNHLSLLEKMLEDGRGIAEEIKTRESSLMFKYGYHASPSMTRLHMHVISLDLDSPCLKHKKHWNSFTTGFFINADEIISILREKGKIDLDVKGVYEPMLKLPLKCHMCHFEPKNMPELKQHIKQHIK